MRENEERENNYWIGNWKEFAKRKCTKTPILILQIRSGCEGLNLQNEFSDVYFVSPNWNPTLEDQAIARCHRIGQQKKVFVYRFYMDSLLSNSEKIAENQNKKNIVTYFNIYNNIPDDLKRYIDSFLLDDFIPIKRSMMKYSMDLYTLMKQNEKREKINEFMNRITI